MIAIPFFISWLTGFFFLRNIFKENNQLNGYLWVSLSLGFGLGLSGILGFLSFIIIGKLNTPVLIALHVIVILMLAICSRRRKWDFFQLRWQEILPTLIWIAGFFLAFIKSKRFPFGGWDAWALWNTKTKILALGENWMDIFTHLSYHSQPDYPLMLPFINTWVYAASHAPLPWVNQITACVMSTMLGIALYGALRLFLKPFTALILSLIVFLNPFFLLLSTIQYSDVLLSFYLLCAMMLFLKSFNTHASSFIILLGVSLGFMSFTKNEGIVLAGLMTGCFILSKLIQKNTSFKDRLLALVPFIISLTLSGLAILYFKLILAPSNPDIPFFLDAKSLPFFNLNGVKTTWLSIWIRSLNQEWNHIWIFIIALCAFGITSLKEKRIILGGGFFVLYFCILTYVYLTTQGFDLQWRLNNTLDRIFFILLPSLFYFACTMALGRKEVKEEQAQAHSSSL